MATISPPKHNKGSIAFLQKIKYFQASLLQEMKESNDSIDQYIESLKKKTLSYCKSYEEIEAQVNEEEKQFELTLKSSNDLTKKLELEKNILQVSISHQERTNSEMEELVFNKFPNEFKNIEYLYKKEIEIHQKIKKENSLKNDKSNLIYEIKETIDLFKEVSGIEVNKTPEGWLKVVLMKGIRNEKIKEDFYIILEIQQGQYHVTQMYPLFNSKKYEEELNRTQNFSQFLSKIIVNEYSQYLNSDTINIK